MNVLIAGGGKVGAHLATLLLAAGHHVTIVEVRGDHCDALRPRLAGAACVAGSATDPELLERSGVRAAQVVAAVTGSDEVNLVVSNLARFEFGVPRIIARVNDPRNAWLYTHAMGVDVALDQADLMAHLVVEEMALGDMMTLLKLRRGQYSLVEEKIQPHAAVVGKAVRDLRLPQECVLAAILREGALVIPRGETLLQAGDEVLAVVHADAAASLAAALGDGRTSPSPAH